MDMSQYQELFVSETQEHLQAMNEAILELERGEEVGSPLAQLFRSAHTIKGMAATMGYDDLSHLAHDLEDLMDRVRKGDLTVTPPLVDLLFTVVDAIQSMVEDIAAGRESRVDLPSLLAQIGSYGSASIPSPDEPSPVAEATAEPGAEQTLAVHVTLQADCALKSVRAFMVSKRLGELGRVVGYSPSEDDLAQENFDREFTVFLSTTAPAAEVERAVQSIAEVESVQAIAGRDEESLPSPQAELLTVEEPGSAKPAFTAAPRPASAPAVAQNVRVNVRHLDALVNLTGELVISRSRLKRVIKDGDAERLAEAMEDHTQIISRLQEAVLQVRMVPVSYVFNRFPRMVRDLLKKEGKEADLIIEGADIELDRSILERLGDPLLHLLRNAVDHGLEPPEERERLGKPRRGVIRLSARRERGQAVIEVSDDGRGLSREDIVRRTIEQGIITPERATDLSDEQVYMFICNPGFSTSEQVTEVSGRGVGMGVVKEQVSALRGMLEIHSVEGQGTTFLMHIPLTLAIIQALLVGVGDESYAVPLSYVERTVLVEAGGVKRVHRWQMTTLDGEVIPLFHLGEMLDVPDYSRDGGSAYVLIVRRGQQAVGLVADAILGKEEVVVKPLRGFLGEITGVSGATILGGGQVVLILDVPALLQELR